MTPAPLLRQSKGAASPTPRGGSSVHMPVSPVVRDDGSPRVLASPSPAELLGAPDANVHMAMAATGVDDGAARVRGAFHEVFGLDMDDFVKQEHAAQAAFTSRLQAAAASTAAGWHSNDGHGAVATASPGRTPRRVAIPWASEVELATSNEEAIAQEAAVERELEAALRLFQ